MKIALMQDSKSWIVDKYTEYIMKYAPPGWKFTIFPPDIKIDDLIRLSKKHEIIYSSYWQPFLRNRLYSDDNFPGYKVVIQTWHLMRPDHHSYDGRSTRLAHKNIKHIAYPCRNTQERLGLMGAKANLYKLDMCCDVESFKHVEPEESGDMLVIGSFNKVYPRKRFDLIECALDEMDNVRLITTHGIDHPKGEKLEHLNDKDFPEVFSQLNVYVSTSDEEGGPVGVLQAMACGIPIITTDTGFSGDIIRHGVNGFKIPFNDAQALIKRLEWIRENPGRAKVIGENGKMTVSKYTPEVFSGQYIDLFKKIKESF